MDLIVLYILILVVPTIAQLFIKVTYSRYKMVENDKKISGQEVARAILDANGLQQVHIVEIKGNLTDHFDPNKNVVRLSTDIFHGETIAAAAVAAHECGHAIQHKEGYSWIRIRTALCPIVNFLTYVAYICFFLSVLLQMADAIMLSITLVVLSLLFQIVTLPVEFDASRRAIAILDELYLINDDEQSGAKLVLKAAAFTYVAAIVSSVLNLIRLLIIFNNRNDKR